MALSSPDSYPAQSPQETVWEHGGAQRKHRENMASLWSKYKVTEAQFQSMMNSQKGLCNICLVDFGTVEKRACLDHDHYTNQPRGLLCTQCNTRIGWLEKNIYRLIPYLQQR
jgi:hypothetical protein